MNISGQGCHRLKGALVGFGYIMEKGHAPTYRQLAGTVDDVEIVAIADICRARRERALEIFPNARIYDNHRALLECEMAKLDFVDVATPPCDHAAVAMDALDFGLHVLCEKPLASSTEHATAMLRRAMRAGRVVFPCHNYRHAPVIKAVRKLIASGDIGEPHLVTLQTFRNTHARGVAEWRPDWRRERRFSGGGIAMDHGSHTFYLAFEWMGSYPTSITAHAMPAGPADTEDEFTATLRFPNGVASAHLSWTAGVRKVLYTIHGDRGAIRVEDDRIEIARLRRDRGRAGQAEWNFENAEMSSGWMDSSHVGWFGSLFAQFRSAIERADYVGFEALEAFRCVQLIQMGYLSASEDSRRIAVQGPGILATIDELPEYPVADAAGVARSTAKAKPYHD
jgi:predicted dehydrogenase